VWFHAIYSCGSIFNRRSHWGYQHTSKRYFDHWWPVNIALECINTLTLLLRASYRHPSIDANTVIPISRWFSPKHEGQYGPYLPSEELDPHYLCRFISVNYKHYNASNVFLLFVYNSDNGASRAVYCRGTFDLYKAIRVNRRAFVPSYVVWILSSNKYCTEEHRRLEIALNISLSQIWRTALTFSVFQVSITTASLLRISLLIIMKQSRSSLSTTTLLL